jgi:hypothetical protein
LHGLAALKGLAIYALICSVGFLSNIGVAQWIYMVVGRPDGRSDQRGVELRGERHSGVAEAGGLQTLGSGRAAFERVALQADVE